MSYKIPESWMYSIFKTEYVKVSPIFYEKLYYPNCKIFRELYPQAEILGDKLLIYKVRRWYELEPVILSEEEGFTFILRGDI